MTEYFVREGNSTLKCSARDIQLSRCEMSDINLPRIFLDIHGSDYIISEWKMLAHFLNELTQEEGNGISVDELMYLSAHAPFSYLIGEFMQIGYRLNTTIGLAYKVLPHRPFVSTITGIIKNIENTKRYESFRNLARDLMLKMPVPNWSNSIMFFNHHKIKLNNKDRIYTTYPVLSFKDEQDRHFIDLVILNENRISIRGRYMSILENNNSFVQPLPYRLIGGPNTITKGELNLTLMDYIAALDKNWNFAYRPKIHTQRSSLTIPSWSDKFSFHEINRDQHYIFNKFVKPE